MFYSYNSLYTELYKTSFDMLTSETHSLVGIERMEVHQVSKMTVIEIKPRDI